MSELVRVLWMGWWGSTFRVLDLVSSTQALFKPYYAIFHGMVAKVCDLNFVYLAWVVEACPGVWTLNEGRPSDEFEWRDADGDCAAMAFDEFLRLRHQLTVAGG